MVNTPPFQRRGKCGHVMPHFDGHMYCYGCRAKCKGQDPCAQGADSTQCAACASLSQDQWAQLRETFAKRSAYRNRSGSQTETQEESGEPVFSGADLSQVDDSILDIPETSTGTDLPVTGIFPLHSSPANFPGESTEEPTGPVLQTSSSSTDATAFFKAPAPPPSFSQGYASSATGLPTPGRAAVTEKMAALSLPVPQRTASASVYQEVPQTPRTQLIKAHLEQQNFQMMSTLQKQNQEQIKDLSSQLQTGLQAFLQQSMETMFNRLAPAQPPTHTQPATQTTNPVATQATTTTVSNLLPTATEEPMDATSAPNPQPPQVKKGLTKIKGTSAVATQSIQAVVSQVTVPTSVPSTTAPPAAVPAPRLQSPLQRLEQEEYGTDTSSASLPTSKPEDIQDLTEQPAPPNLPFRELVQKVREFLSIPDPASEEDYKLGSALGRDPLLLQQEKADRPPSIKLPMVADLSRLQSAQDDSVKPNSSTDIGKLPGIPPHKGSWYNVVDNKFSQTPQVVPQAFTNIAKPGYRSGPPASVQQKDIIKLEYMTRENISITNFLSTFGMASESCLNNLRLSREQRERQIEQLLNTPDGPARDQLRAALNATMLNESSQMQFMLDISRSMSKAYADLVANILSTLTNLVLIRRDAYLRHAHPSLDAFRVRNLRSASISGGDLFDRAVMQEYEQHLIGLGIKPGSKKDQRFHPYKKAKRGRGNQRHQPQGVYYQAMPAPQYMVQQPVFQQGQGSRRGGRGGRRGRGRGSSTSHSKQQQPPQ